MNEHEGVVFALCKCLCVNPDVCKTDVLIVTCVK